MRRVCPLLLVALGLLVGANDAMADRPVAVGPYAQVSLGGRKVVGQAKRRAAIGTQAELKLGTDLFSWLSVGGRLELSNHEATVPAPPVGEYMQFYGAAAEARLSLRIRRVSVFAEGSLGYAYVSTNILEKVDILEPGERFSPTLGAGGGLEYQLQNRHYAFGMSGFWNLYAGFRQMHTVSALATLRYTY